MSILGGFWLHLGTQGGSPEMLFRCPEGSWGYLGAKMVPKMVPRSPKRPPGDAKTDFDQILMDLNYPKTDFDQISDGFLSFFWLILGGFLVDFRLNFGVLVCWFAGCLVVCLACLLG